MEAKQILPELPEGEKSVYYNEAGVQFYVIADGPFFVSADYPGMERQQGAVLELYQQFDSVGHLIETLHLSGIEQLTKLAPEDLLPLYEREEINIVCTLEGRVPREMNFRKYKGCLWASNTSQEIHEVTMHLEQPQDFIAYTLRYYGVNDN